MESLIFYLIAGSGCLFALLTVISRDIFHSAVWLALTLLSVSGIYFYLDAELLGVVQILVYVGGIMTLFVFAIQLTANMGDKAVRQTNEQGGAAFFISAAIVAIMMYGSSRTPRPLSSDPLVPADTASLGLVFFQNYVLAFEILSVILLMALIGALFLARQETDHDRQPGISARENTAVNRQPGAPL